MLVRGRLVSLGFVVLSAIVSGGSCTSGADDQTPIPASPGGTQPPAGEATLSELEACDRLRDAEEKARRRLNCPELDRADCPGYVRPAGSGCWLYDEDSLGACEEMLGTYEVCSDFVQRPCVITAVSIDPSRCPSLGAGGEGGHSGAGGESPALAGGRGGRGGPGGRGGRGGSGGEDASQSGQAGAGGTGPEGGASGESGSAGATD